MSIVVRARMSAARARRFARLIEALAEEFADGAPGRARRSVSSARSTCPTGRGGTARCRSRRRAGRARPRRARRDHAAAAVAVAPRRLHEAVDRPDDQPVRRRGHTAGDPAGGRPHPRGDAVRVRPAWRPPVPALHPAHDPRRGVGRPDAAEADPHRREHGARGAAGVDPGRLPGRLAHHLAAVRRRVRDRLPRGLLRRRLPVVPAERRRARPAGGGQREARAVGVGDQLRRADRRGLPGRPLRPAIAIVFDVASYSAPSSSCSSSAGRRRRPSRTIRPRGRAHPCGRRPPRACATCSGTGTCATSPPAPGRSTCSATSAARS